MSSSSAMEVHQRGGIRAPSTDAYASVVAAGVFALGVAIVDLLTYHVNLPIVYIVPLLLIERANNRKWIWQAAAILVVLTFIGYVLGRSEPGAARWPEFGGSRLVNRTMTALTIVTATMLLHAGIAMRERAGRLKRVWPHDPDGLSYERAVLSIDRVLAPVLAAILVVAFFVSDTASRPGFNIAVLYLLPMLILARTRSVAMIWCAVPVLIGAALLGLYVEPAAARLQPGNLVLNRALVCVALAGIAVIVHSRLREESRD